MSETTISTTDQLRTALLDPTPDRTVNIAPGIYERASGGFGSNAGVLRGQPDAPIAFRALDPNNKPEIRGGMYLPGMARITFDGLRLTRPSAHNVNADDIGHRDACPGISWLNCEFESLPHLTAFVSIKATRLDDVLVRGCRFLSYGEEAVDFVGVHGGRIEGNDFLGAPGFDPSMALQLKGGTWDIEVVGNLLVNGGRRGIQAGGGSSEVNSRPQTPEFEAERINIHDNIVIGGSKSSFVFSTQRQSRFHHNLCYLPERWICRILQENSYSQPNQRGEIDHNLFVYPPTLDVNFVNQGGQWLPETFRVHDNAYFQSNGHDPAWPKWPGGIVESDAIKQVAPALMGSDRTLRITSGDPRFIGIGPQTGGPTMTTWSIITGATPPGIELNPITGEISGIPLVAGMSTFTVRGSGDAGDAVRQYSVVIFAANNPLAVMPETLVDGQVGQPYSAQLTLDVA